jgi:two-component system response regulator TtrR
LLKYLAVMAEKGKKQVFFLDGEAEVHEAAEEVFAELAEKVEITYFTNGRNCLSQIVRSGCDVLITELDLPDIDGTMLLTKARQIIALLPVIAITDRGNVPKAVKAIKAGAYDVVEKPIKGERFRSVFEGLLEKTILLEKLGYKSLTEAEKKVLLLLMEGKGNKQIARKLSRSVRTIEDHRSKIMHKLNVDNAVDLTKRAAALGFLKLQ